MYVDGFVLPVPTKKLQTYRQLARKAGRVWREYGALEFRENVLDDLDKKMGPAFTRAVRLKSGETILFSWIVYKSKADRNRINAKVMKDPRIAESMDPATMPFDVKRMGMAGFKNLVNL